MMANTDPRDATVVAAKFSATAAMYAASEQKAGDDLDAVVAAVRSMCPLDRQLDLVVDVATGPGSTALDLAPLARRVVGTDISSGMVATADGRARESGLTNVEFRVADVTDLPFDDGEADAVTCRIAAHHFPDVPSAFAEIARVVRPGGRLVLLDSEAPEDDEVASFLHLIETRRDPTHVHSYTAREWAELVTVAGFDLVSVERYPKPKAFEPWLVRGGVGEDVMEAVRELVRLASPAVRAALSIEYDHTGNPTRFADDKTLIVATRRGGDGPAVVERPFEFVGFYHVQRVVGFGSAFDRP